MRRYHCLVLFIVLLGSTAAIADERFDGAKDLLCASIEAMDCVSGVTCDKNLPETIGAPQFLRINFARKEITGPKRTTPVLHMEKTEDQFLLQGIELNMGWVFAVDRATGRFSATLTNGEGAFVIFGACTPL